MSLFYRRRMLLNRKKQSQETYMTTLFTDGTFIINEKASDRAANIASHGAVTNEYAPLDSTNTYVFANAAARPWHNQRTSIKSVKFGSVVQPTSMANWFTTCNQMTSFDSTNLDTSNVTDMTSMFAYCSSLTSIDVSSWNTSNVTQMASTFGHCASLTSLDLSSWNTSNVTGITSLVANCTSLTSIDLSGFDTSNVTYMNNVFSNCPALTSIDLSSFDTSNVTTMRAMFDRCTSLTSLDLSNFDTSNVTDMRTMFYGCTALASLIFGKPANQYNINVNTGTNLSTGTFVDCSSLQTLQLNGSNILQATSSYTLRRMKSDCQIKVPAELVDQYKTATNWSARASYIFAQP